MGWKLISKKSKKMSIAEQIIEDATKFEEIERGHEKFVHKIKHANSSHTELSKYICASYGTRKSIFSDSECKYKYTWEFDNFMEDFPEYIVLSVSENTSHDFKTTYNVWMALKSEEAQFFENI